MVEVPAADVDAGVEVQAGVTEPMVEVVPPGEPAADAAVEPEAAELEPPPVEVRPERPAADSPEYAGQAVAGVEIEPPATEQAPDVALEAGKTVDVRAWEAAVAGVVEPEAALEELGGRLVETHGWPETDLADVNLVTPAESNAPEQEHDPGVVAAADVSGESGDRDRSVAAEQASKPPAPVADARAEEWPPRGQPGPHLGGLPGLDRMKHLFGRRRE
ncbi:MAG TPA: hypothetical protein VKB30_09090 [Candidatus Limnocylindrales bacterium]|nr:hypothetical protein [Candidatus Limnocylindrales bacterium]